MFLMDKLLNGYVSTHSRLLWISGVDEVFRTPSTGLSHLQYSKVERLKTNGLLLMPKLITSSVPWREFSKVREHNPEF